MSEPSTHLSLYRRWRPQTFAEVVGQEEIVRTLRNAVRNGDVGHAYLFAGERGIGKTSIARILSRAVNCLHPEDGEPCNVCENCKAILANRALDMVEIDGASNRGIDHIRKLREEVNFVPTNLQRKVYIIDEVHMLTNEAFNALLKTLEEPPAHVMFAFATTEPHKVPRTIVSRCQVFDFRRLPTEQISAQLAAIAAKESVQMQDAARDLLARRANGGMRDALVMLEQAMSYEGGTITEDAVLDMLGLAGHDTQEAFLRGLRKHDTREILRIVDGLVERGKDLEVFLADVIQTLREEIAAEPENVGRTILLARGLLQIKADLFRALDRQIRLEIGLVDLMERLDPAARPTGPATQEKASSPRGRSRPARAAATDASEDADEEAVRQMSEDDDAVPSEAPAKPPARTPAPLASEESDKWRTMLREVEKDRIAIAAYLTEAMPRLESGRLTLLFHPEHTFHKESLEKHENLQYLAGVVRRHFGDAIRVDVELDDAVVRKPLPRDALLEKARLVCEVFDGTIVKEAF